ncbi:MAG: hypothetical protein ACOYKN_17385 [Pirellula sp.]
MNQEKKLEQDTVGGFLCDSVTLWLILSVRVFRKPTTEAQRLSGWVGGFLGDAISL